MLRIDDPIATHTATYRIAREQLTLGKGGAQEKEGSC